MKDPVLSEEGDKWSVKFDVRDLGGHLDTAFRGWSGTPAARVRLVLIFVLPLDFHGRVCVVRSMYLPAALHGVEASLLASDSLLKFRSSICRVVWSRRQPLACVGAVLSLLDGPLVVTLCFVLSGFGFVSFVGFWLCGPLRLVVLIDFWIMVCEGCPGHGPIHLLVACAAEIGFRWDQLVWLGLGLVCPCSVIWLALFSTLELLFLMPGGTRLRLIFVVVKVFGVGPYWIFMALCSSLTLLMFEIEIRVCFGVFWSEVCGMVFC